MNEANRRWINIKEASLRLGLHPVSLYRMAARRQIPAAKLGGRLLIDWKQLEANLENQFKRYQ